MQELFGEYGEFNEMVESWIDDFLFDFYNKSVDEIFQNTFLVEMFDQLNQDKLTQDKIQEMISTVESKTVERINDLAVAVMQLHYLYNKDERYTREFNARECLELLKKLDDNFENALFTTQEKDNE